MKIALAVTLCLAISPRAFAAESVDKAPPPGQSEDTKGNIADLV